MEESCDGVRRSWVWVDLDSKGLYLKFGFYLKFFIFISHQVDVKKLKKPRRDEKS